MGPQAMVRKMMATIAAISIHIDRMIDGRNELSMQHVEWDVTGVNKWSILVDNETEAHMKLMIWHSLFIHHFWQSTCQ